MIIRVGTSGYAYREWKGSFYPKKIAASAMLGHYASRLSTVEINNTFYRMPEPGVVGGWSEQTPSDFSFVLKAPQRITHIARLKNAAKPLRTFLRAAAELGPKQGPLLFQLPPNFKKDVPRLRRFLGLLPATVRAAVEFRHASWFDDHVYELLRDRKVALCAAHTKEGKTPLVATAPFGYLRLRGVRYTNVELARWADDVRAQSWSEAWIFFKHEDQGRGPKLAKRLLAALK